MSDSYPTETLIAWAPHIEPDREAWLRTLRAIRAL